AYPPEIRSSSTLMKELAVGLVDRGYEVSVLATYPSYNLTDEDRDRFARKASNLVMQEHGVRVIRVPTPALHNIGSIRKGLAQVILPLILAMAGACLKRVDAIIVYSPPITLGLAAAALKARFGARVVFNAQDLFPQNAVDLGVLRNPALIRMFEEIEAASFRGADVVTCHSEGNIDWLRRHPALRKRPGDVRLVHNWVDIDGYRNSAADRSVRRRLGLEGKFVFFFGGVMGFAQELDTVIDAARRLEDDADIAFLLVGDGVEKAGLERRARGLENVVFHPFIPPDQYVTWLKAMDVGLVTLRAEMKTPVVPSKILGFMAAGVPYLALLNRESDARAITRDGGCGVIVDPGDVEAVVRACRRLASDRAGARRMGARGLDYCRRNFSKDGCIDKYDRILQSFSRKR
ncbi:MAG: glycosyltransferase family 4 protein, partial [Deltaproteobacteria bacterium]|nr:glycosyltransferase family 4 protein [Deltaproteobacteria bacterium]